MRILLEVSWRPWFSEIVIFLVWVCGLILTLISILAQALTVWRLGADAGYMHAFFIAEGLLSHYPAWIVIAVGAQAAGVLLKRWAAGQVPGTRMPARSEASPQSLPESGTAAATA